MWCALMVLSQTSSPPWGTILLFLTMGLVHLSWFLNGQKLYAYRVRSIFLFFVLTRFLSYFGEPLFEDDYYRYLWDGIVGSNLGNALVISPDEVLLDTNLTPDQPSRQEGVTWRRELLSDEDRDELLLKINYPESPSIYGPVAQLALSVQSFPMKVLGFVSSGTGPDLNIRILWLRTFLILIEAVVIWMFFLWTKHQSSGRWMTLCLASCPLLMKEVSNSLHLDILPVALVLASVLVQDKYQKLSSILLALAAGVKFYAIALLPIFLIRSRQPLKSSLLFILTLLTIYLPFLVSGGLEIFSGTRYFSHQWSMNDGVTAIIREVLYHTISDSSQSFNLPPIGEIEVSFIQSFSRRSGLLLFTLSFIWLLNRFYRPLKQGASLAFPYSFSLILIVLCSPVQNPWYLLWGLPFFIRSSHMAPMLLVSLSPLYLFNFVWSPTSHLFHEPFQWWVILPQTLVIWFFISEAAQGKALKTDNVSLRPQ
jgi:alpha-1,6-mannosyltransferase